MKPLDVFILVVTFAAVTFALSLVTTKARAGAPEPFSAIALSENSGALERSARQKRAFRAAHPCPATARASGPCPGWIVDHVVPLCAGGPDHPANMQWQTVEKAKAKDREEHALCARMRKERK